MYHKVGQVNKSEILDLISKIDQKDLNYRMGFVNPYKSIHQNSLGHSQSWRFKKQKKVSIF